MTDISDPTAPAAVEAPATINQQYAAHLVAQHIVSKAQTMTTTMRSVADARMIEAYNAPGDNGRVKTHEVVVDGVLIGAFTVEQPQPKAYLDDEGREELIAWLSKHNKGALTTKVVVEIDPNVIKAMTDPQFIRFSTEEGGPVVNAKTGEALPGFKTKLAGEATKTKAVPFTGKVGKAKKEAAQEKLEQLAEHFDLDAIAAAYAALEASPAIVGEVVHHPTAPVEPEPESEPVLVSAAVDETRAAAGSGWDL